MKTSVKGIALFSALVMIAFIIGSYVLTATFFGIVMLTGMIVVIETIPPLKWLVSRMTSTLDVVIFVATILATAMLGLNITAGLTVAGLGFTLIYAPYLREQRRARKQAPNYNHSNNTNQFDRR
jgi:hypothetical protein